MSDEGSRLFDPGLIARSRLRRWAAVAVGVLVVLRFGAEITPVLKRPDLVLLDQWQSLRAIDHPSPQIVIVAIDEKSIARFGPPAWPRSEYVPLVERLAKAGAKVIGFDFTFGPLEREAANNRSLAEAMKKAGNVVFGYEFTDVGDPSPPGTPPSEVMLASALSQSEPMLMAIPPAPSLIEPEPALAAAAAALGHVYTVFGEDGRIRTLPLVIQHGGKAYPALGLQIARVYTGTPQDQVALGHGAVIMGAWSIPVSESGEVLLNWPADGEKAFPQYSFLDVVRGDVPDEAFRDKAVLVAGTAPGLDERALPFAAKAAGVLIHATFLDNVFRFDFVQAPLWAWLVEWGLFLAVCALVVGLLPRLSTTQLLVGVPVLALLLLGGAGFLYVQKGIWLKVFYPGLALVAPLAVIVALRLTASERETRDVTAEKVENQKLLGLSFQEKGMLDMALATFNKLPFTEDMKLVYVNLGLDYENRGLRDKAFLVYKKVFELDPTFEDVVYRMERLSQAGASPSLFTAPTMSGSPSQTPAQPAATGSPLAGQVPTLDGSSPTSPEMGPTALRPPVEPPGAAQTPIPQPDRIPTPAPVTPMHRTPISRTPMPPPPGGATGGPMLSTASGGPVLPGSRFKRYEVERHLGRGGMGDVYLVRDTIMNRRAALKTIRLDADLDAQHAIEMRQRFYREGQVAGQLTHPNIVTIYDLDEDLGMSYIVMEFVEGQTLSQLMKKERLNLPQIKHVICNAGIALDYAHQNGIFHLDVKPDNIMVSRTGVVKVMDFGIAHVVASTLTRTGSVMGTPAYMSPEQVNGQKIDARSDIFSLGVILYELLTGKKPFTGETMPSLMFAIIKDNPAHPSTIDGRLHTNWDDILAKALAKDREERFATAQQFVEAIRGAR
jgi:CHASE2 domain-containing sensor protein/predicted Ser/Thr protein kinase